MDWDTTVTLCDVRDVFGGLITERKGRCSFWCHSTAAGTAAAVLSDLWYNCSSSDFRFSLLWPWLVACLPLSSTTAIHHALFHLRLFIPRSSTFFALLVVYGLFIFEARFTYTAATKMFIRKLVQQLLAACSFSCPASFFCFYAPSGNVTATFTLY